MSDVTETTPKGPMSRRGKRVSVLAVRFPRLVKLARVTTFAVCIVVVLGFFALRRAEGQMGEQLVGMGELLMQYDGRAHQDETRALLLNGERLQFSSGTSPDDVTTVLDRFETVCEQHDGGMVAQFATIRSQAPSHRLLDPIYRYEAVTARSHTGVVACLDLGAQSIGMDELRARIDRFRATGDVNEVGDIRYVYAEPAGDGTHFVAFWTDGPFNLLHIVPSDGDAGGSDLTDVPRPPGSRRTLCASEAGNDDAAVQYMGSTMNEWELEHYYSQQLLAHGWTVVATPEDRQPDGLRIVEAHDAELSQLLFMTLDTDEDGRGMATIALSR